MKSISVFFRWFAVTAILGAAATAGAASTTAVPAPLAIASEGWIFAGGHVDESIAGHPMVGQLYAEYQIPQHRTHPYPVVMIPGGLQSGTNFTGTPDGREGWAQYFLRRGYAVYVVDPPGRGRAAYSPEAYGPVFYPTQDFTEQRFTAPERFKMWPQAYLHTQFPGTGSPGDPAFDAFLQSEEPSLVDFVAQQNLMRDAGAALLDKIGPAIILVHSQSGAFACRSRRRGPIWYGPSWRSSRTARRCMIFRTSARLTGSRRMSR